MILAQTPIHGVLKKTFGNEIKNEHAKQVLYHSQTPHVQGPVVTDNVFSCTAEYRHDNPTNIA